MLKQINKRKKKQNQAESTIYQTEKTLNELGDKVSAEDKSAIESALENLKSVKDKESSTAEELKTAMDEVMNKFHKISEQMYQQAQAAQGAEGAQDAGYDQGANAGNGDDNVVDADFTEVDDKQVTKTEYLCIIYRDQSVKVNFIIACSLTFYKLLFCKI